MTFLKVGGRRLLQLEDSVGTSGRTAVRNKYSCLFHCHCQPIFGNWPFQEFWRSACSSYALCFLANDHNMWWCDCKACDQNSIVRNLTLPNPLSVCGPGLILSKLHMNVNVSRCTCWRTPWRRRVWVSQYILSTTDKISPIVLFLGWNLKLFTSIIDSQWLKWLVFCCKGHKEHRQCLLLLPRSK